MPSRAASERLMPSRALLMPTYVKKRFLKKKNFFEKKFLKKKILEKKIFEKFFFWNMQAYTYMQTYEKCNNRIYQAYS